eukprot:9218618-Karenia_brevis.AAC.1
MEGKATGALPRPRPCIHPSQRAPGVTPANRPRLPTIEELPDLADAAQQDDPAPVVVPLSATPKP